MVALLLKEENDARKQDEDTAALYDKVCPHPLPCTFGSTYSRILAN